MKSISYTLNNNCLKVFFSSQIPSLKKYVPILTSKITGIPLDELEEDFRIMKFDDNIFTRKIGLFYKSLGAYFNYEFNPTLKEAQEKNSFSYIFQVLFHDIMTSEEYTKPRKVFRINFNNFDSFKLGQVIYDSYHMEETCQMDRKIGIRSFDISMNILEKMDYNDIEKYSTEYYLYVLLGKEDTKKLYEEDELMTRIVTESESFQKMFDQLFF